jgi:hypothetical protein
VKSVFREAFCSVASFSTLLKSKYLCSYCVLICIFEIICYVIYKLDDDDDDDDDDNNDAITR